MIYGNLDVPDPHVIDELRKKRTPVYEERPQLPLPLPSPPQTEKKEKESRGPVIIQL